MLWEAVFVNRNLSKLFFFLDTTGFFVYSVGKYVLGM